MALSDFQEGFNEGKQAEKEEWRFHIKKRIDKLSKEIEEIDEKDKPPLNLVKREIKESIKKELKGLLKS